MKKRGIVLSKLINFKILIISLMILTGSLFAQTNGKIIGKVVDAETGEALISANVLIETTTMGAAADINGDYEISSVPAGSYNLIFSIIGYAKSTVTNVNVVAGQVTKIDIALKSEAFQTDEVVITAEAILDSDAGLLKNRQKSISVSDAISSDLISKSGSGDAASAMTKVTGASVVGGKYVYIRGLGERYSATTLNGSELPSADPDKKSFQLDLLPSNLLENIVTLKTFTPDKPGTFSGGLVDVSIKSHPEQFMFQVSTSSSYNSMTTFNDNYFLPNTGNTDWLGFDDGTRDIPDLLADPNIDIPRASAIKTKEEALMLDQFSRSFNNFMAPIPATANPSQSLSLSIGNQIILGESSLGYLGSMTWSQDYNFYDDGEIGRFNLTGPIADVTGLDPQRKLVDQRATREANWGAVASLSFKNSSIGKITASYIKTQSGISEARYLSGFWKDLPSTATFETRVLSWTERSLNTFQFQGEHKTNLLFNNNIDWTVSYSKNTQDEPDQRYFSNHYSTRIRNGVEETTYQSPASLYPPPIRYYRNLKEINFNSNLNFTVPIEFINNHANKIKFGGAYTKIDRTYDQRRFEYAEDDIRYKDYGPDVNNYFSVVGILDTSESYFSFGNVIGEAKSLKNNFKGFQEVVAAYFMTDIFISKEFRLIAGARLETTNMEGKSADPSLPVGILDNSDFLPSLNLVYQLSDEMNVRAAYTHTIARPTFRELAPYTSFEFVGDFLFEGNANLKRTLIKNYDLRWEWFLNPGELLAISAFYKDFENPLEKFQNNSIPNGLLSIQNVDNAYLLGVEFELRKNLGILADFLGNFNFGTNFTLVDSKVDIPKIELDLIRISDPSAEATRQFQGQSPYLFNLNMTYDNFDEGFYAGLFYNIFGDRLAIVTEGANPDVFEVGYSSLDIKLSKSFDLLNISFSAKNLLDPDIKMVQDLKGQEFIYYKYKKGITLGVSLGLKI